MSKNIFVSCNNNIEKMQEILDLAKAEGYVMANDFNKDIPTAKKLYETFKKYYHGNSKMILNFFYNDITNRKEISYGTRSVYSSYPQYKKLKIIKIS